MATNTNARLTGIAVGTAAVGALALTVSMFSASSALPGASGDRAPFGTSVAGLSRAANADDSLPADVLALPAASRFDPTQRANVRRVGESGNRSYWAVPGRGGELCLIATSGSGATFDSAGTCAPRSQLAQGGIWFSETNGTTGDQTLAVLTPDGVAQVATPAGQKVPVQQNFAVVNLPAAGSPTLRMIDRAGAGRQLVVGRLTHP